MVLFIIVLYSTAIYRDTVVTHLRTCKFSHQRLWRYLPHKTVIQNITDFSCKKEKNHFNGYCLGIEMLSFLKMLLKLQLLLSSSFKLELATSCATQVGFYSMSKSLSKMCFKILQFIGWYHLTYVKRKTETTWGVMYTISTRQTTLYSGEDGVT